MRSVTDDGAHDESTRLMRARSAALTTGAAIAAASLAEMVLWQLLGDAIDFGPLLWATLILACACALLAAAAACIGRFRRAALVLVLAIGLSPFVRHGLSHNFRTLQHLDEWALALSPLPAVLLLWFAGRGVGRTLLLGSVPVLLGIGAWQHHARTASGPRAGGVSHSDVILLVMDTTRRDRLGAYGYARPTTAHIDSLSQTGQVFDNAWANSSWTPPSHATLLTGLLPAEHGVDGVDQVAFNPSVTTLAEVLRHAGYRTGAAVANPNLTGDGWSRGFHDYLTCWERGRHSLTRWLNIVRFGTDGGWPLKTEFTPNTLALAREWWASSSDAPRFLLVNLIDPHFPYRPPEAFYRRFLPDVDPARAYAINQVQAYYQVHPGVPAGDAAILSSLYDAELAYMDEQLGAFFDWLAQRGELDKTLLVITSDHGERLGERGLLGHQVMMDPYLLRVPLIVRFPPHVPPGRKSELVQHAGVPGYILSLLGIEAPEPMRSRSLDRATSKLLIAQCEEPEDFLRYLQALTPEFDSTPLLGDWNFVSDGRYAWISSTHAGTGGRGLFDLVLDPDCSHDLSASLTEKAEPLQTYARGLPVYSHLRVRNTGPASPEQLRALGYAGDR